MPSLGYVLYKRKRGETRQPGLTWRVRLDKLSILLLLALLIAASVSLALSVKLAAINPWGYWDAWARINVKARFLFGGGDQWSWIFASGHIAHHDYPLLLPCTVARSLGVDGRDFASVRPQGASVLPGEPGRW